MIGALEHDLHNAQNLTTKVFASRNPCGYIGHDGISSHVLHIMTPDTPQPITRVARLC